MSQSGVYITNTGPLGFVETLTGNSGGAVPPTAGNINVKGDGTTITVSGNPGTSTLTISATAQTPITFNEDSGSATAAADIINVFSGGQGRATPNTVTVGSGNTISVDLRNVIKLGDLSNLGSALDALTLVTGNETISVGNLNVSQGLIFVNGASSNRGGITITSTKAGLNNDGFVVLSKNPGVSLQLNESMGNIQWQGTDASSIVRVAANIDVTATVNPPVGNVPCQMTFFTSGAFSGSTARMVLTSNGGLLINAPESGVGLNVSGGGVTAGGTITFTSLGAGAVSSSAGGVLSSGTLSVANGGTGATTLTQHGVLLGQGTSAITATSVGSSGQVLIGATGADPAFATLTSSASSLTYTTGANSLNIDIANYANLTSWTPTVVGGSVAGTTTYSFQSGRYTRIGNLIWATASMTVTGATGTGDATFSLPITASGTPSNALGTCSLQATGWTWPANGTTLFFSVNGSAATGVFTAMGSAKSLGNLQMANAAANIIYSVVYSA